MLFLNRMETSAIIITIHQIILQGTQIFHHLVMGFAQPSQEIHMICEVTDTGSPPLTRYQRVVIHIKNP